MKRMTKIVETVVLRKIEEHKIGGKKGSKDLSIENKYLGKILLFVLNTYKFSLVYIGSLK